jgi:hypothetical protein
MAQDGVDKRTPLEPGTLHPKNPPVVVEFDRDFNTTHAAMVAGRLAGVGPTDLVIHSEKSAATTQPPAKYKPTLSPDYLHDFTLSGKKDYMLWSEVECKKFGLVDQGDFQQKNAFRHAVTAAIYTIKYGENVTSELGWLNEQKDFNIVDSYKGKLDLAKIADTNVDLLNNRSGMNIAKQLLKEKSADKITVEDVENRVLKELKAERLSIYPAHQLRYGTLAPETLSYHSMSGLIKWEAENGPTPEDRSKAQTIVDERHIK